MKKVFGLALIAAASVLSACSSTEAFKAKREANPGLCPNIIVLSDAARMIEFAGDQALENVAYSAEIAKVSLDCRFYNDEPIDASAVIHLAFGKGPAADANFYEYKYFIAVTRSDAEVIAKQVYAVPVKFDDKRDVKIVKEEIEEIIIPRATETTAGTNFEVVVGLVVTPRQAIFNRSGKSLKFPELQ